MTAAGFREELRRVGRSQGVALHREQAIVDAVKPTEDELFVNVFGGADGRDLLLLTSVATHHLYRGLLGVKTRWTVPYSDLENVRPMRAAGAGGYVTDAVVLEARGDLYEFKFGFNDPSYESEVMRQIAEHNADVAAQDIRAAAQLFHSRGPSATPPSRQPAGGGIDYYSH